MGQEAHAQLAKDAGKMGLKAWPGPVIDLYLGKATTQSLLDAAKDPKPAKATEHRSEALFYLGQQALITGKPAEARRWFQQVVEMGLVHSTEYNGAKAELARVGLVEAKR